MLFKIELNIHRNIFRIRTLGFGNNLWAYAGVEPTFIEDDVFKTIIPLISQATPKLYPKLYPKLPPNPKYYCDKNL